MLVLEARAKEGSLRRKAIIDFKYYQGHGCYQTKYEVVGVEPFHLVGRTLFPEGCSVKDALTILADKDGLHGGNSPTFRAWLNDRTEDALVGEELVSATDPTVYRLRPANEQEIAWDGKY